MIIKDTMYVTFEVSVNENNYYGGKHKSVQCNIVLPRSILVNFDPGDIFRACLKSALIEYDNEDEEVMGD